jgi:hypothetical protein
MSSPFSVQHYLTQPNLIMHSPQLDYLTCSEQPLKAKSSVLNLQQIMVFFALYINFVHTFSSKLRVENLAQTTPIRYHAPMN